MAGVAFGGAGSIDRPTGPAGGRHPPPASRPTCRSRPWCCSAAASATSSTSAAVNGESSTELRFKTNQINDILKSLVLEDMGGGKVGVVTYPSQDPIAKTLALLSGRFDGQPSLGDLLNQLRGAKVSLTVGAEQLEGTILGLEKKPKLGRQGRAPDRGVATEPRQPAGRSAASNSTRCARFAWPTRNCRKS